MGVLGVNGEFDIFICDGATPNTVRVGRTFRRHLGLVEASGGVKGRKKVVGNV